MLQIFLKHLSNILGLYCFQCWNGKFWLKVEISSNTAHFVFHPYIGIQCNLMLLENILHTVEPAKSTTLKRRPTPHNDHFEVHPS